MGAIAQDRLDVLGVLSYEVTRSNFRARYAALSEDDFEDRFQDTMERFVKYFKNDGLNPLTAFNTMWRTWAGSNAERKREVKCETIIKYYDPEDVAYTNAGSYHFKDEDNLIRLYKRVKDKLNDKCRAVFLLTAAGYTMQEVADELHTSRQSCELYKNHATVLMAREAGLTNELSRLESKTSNRAEQLRVKKAH